MPDDRPGHQTGGGRNGREIASRETSKHGGGVNEYVTKFTAAVMRILELLMPRKRHKRARRGWSRDVPNKKELETTETDPYRLTQLQGGYEGHRTPSAGHAKGSREHGLSL